MKKIFEISKKINSVFIKVILFLFYYMFIGLISVFYRLFKSKKIGNESYWEDFDGPKFDRDYFRSAY